ncbi:MAG: RNA-directed DNA polymerase [Bacteroidaceae bacterium]|nr:RNA-directed DNA polymerase [Bacteroidaceae bacterium]
MPVTHNTFVIDREQLYADLMQAYLDARRHKRSRRYQQEFEADLERNLTELCDELYNRTYKPLPSDCFIITDPKKREVFAASFRDRIVHHLYYNYVHRMFERTFIHDSYSCIKKKGTHFGIHRLERHIRSESQNYVERCYVLKMDIRGYFMYINRNRLLELCLDSLNKMQWHKVSRYRKELWREVVDIEFVSYLTREIVMLDCTKDCHIKGRTADWEDLPASKSLFHSPSGCGLPIGNLTSQLFSNVYLNVLDQYMKRTLKCRHYGRYVDDFYVVGADKVWLHSLIPRVRLFLRENLGLELHEGKLRIDNVRQGVEFLGAFLKPWRNYVSQSTLSRMKAKIKLLLAECVLCNGNVMAFALKLRSSFNSFCGVLGHYRSYRLRCRLWLERSC